MDVPLADGGATNDAAIPVDCKTMELLAPGYENDVIPHSFAAGERPAGPHASPRAIEDGRVYRRIRVAQYGGTEDVEPPLPTLIKFSFTDGSNQLSGEYCVVQATKGKDGGSVHGHYEMSFVPKSPGSSTNFVVNVTMKPPGTSKFPIGFDGTSDELTLYIDAGSTAYLETYTRVR